MAEKKKTDREWLDEAVRAQAAGTYVDPLAGAQTALAKANNLHLAAESSLPSREQDKARAESTLVGQIKAHPWRTAKEGAIGAALPLAFAGGGVGMAAGGLLSLDALNSAVNDPSAGNVIGAGLGMLPFVGPAKRAMKGASKLRTEAKAVNTMRNTYGAGDMGATLKGSREVPYGSAGGGGAWASNYPQATEKTLGNPQLAVKDMVGGGDILDRMFAENNPGFRRLQRLGLWGERGKAEAAAADAAEAAAKTAKAPASVQALAKDRPADAFVHAADKSGGAFGFDELPEISESELTRLQELFKRVTGR